MAIVIMMNRLSDVYISAENVILVLANHLKEIN